ncbi:MAG: cell filamentation protein Fic [Bacteroidetes bacterium GWF2_42_66]|nr:MAG: cell filamentation protein Fic [Bacteroidetes bacterium GWA2_42_15]OFY01398.1 MAG: cell filamentation protein Fic [Bacteroidetes bacterium GWE2_42_39]OFY42240.1 MAG: cell filamentation protein Fic [Bacteroidetes bacterium GWF2_42_66]HBL77857.1 cell filamentation protein Fic [Prolixibacteraceae bacterium]HCU63338.1 cell filamentation protein Fic [Prolixibacteraceae bacterium]
MKENYSDFILFKTEDEKISVDVRFEDETVWLTQEQMAILFERDRTVIVKHIAKIFSEGELDEKSNVQFLHIANSDKPVKFYNLNVIISVGYRVKSQRGTLFRIWATKRLNEYIRKGFTMDDERLKNLGGGGYWKELLQRIRDIRASEKIFYRQVLDIYSTSIDYDPKAEVSIAFFKKVQNKIHYAVHGKTAAEVIFTRADAEKEFMGLMTFPGSRPYLKDVVVAKNYLDEKELRSLGQIISGYLDFAERQAEREQAMTMKDWAEHLDKILTMSGEKLLLGAGSISHEIAIEKATTEYKKYQQKTLSEAEKNYLESLKVLENKTKKEK